MNIHDLFELVSSEKASDLLISAGAPPILRINGNLFRSRTDALTPEQTQQLIYDFLTEEQKRSFEKHKELDFSLAVGRRHRFRVNVFLQKQAVTAALRPIPEKIPAMDDLGVPDVVKTLARARQGLVLVTGPTGHGKTTTQAAAIDLINNERACHIVTIEDPIEYVHSHKRSIVDQREVGGDTNSFPSALKYVLRQDPDVILIGEMRDLETIKAALTAAETGHLVFATLHTNDAIQTVDRVIDVFPGPEQQQIRFQLSMTLLAILSQRLLPRSDNNGRVLACEVLLNNTAIANLIREGKTHQVYSVLETSSKDGMQTMDRSLKTLYRKGLISFDDASANMRNPKDLKEVG
ncbi:MAG: type IV pilus twitching motility protein PilT [Candidatus Hydrogenedentes bacterium]|nr:type IV pilus twitching motility protein PilT [Candidatus Hydrogenedentota bacterium]MBI3118078.1 type IV pilus twitching motility protein PilT [Candidatus Hydrogenedentota bacterium]